MADIHEQPLSARFGLMVERPPADVLTRARRFLATRGNEPSWLEAFDVVEALIAELESRDA